LARHEPLDAPSAALPSQERRLRSDAKRRATTWLQAAQGDATGAAQQSAAARSPQSLVGLQMPSILFNNFDRRFLDLGQLAIGGLVLYVYPGCDLSSADGARSLDADLLQHRAYSALRDRYAEVVPGGAIVAASSISPTAQFHHSPELAWDQDDCTRFPHYLVSDEMLQLASELGLPTFSHEGETYYERLTLVAHEGRIQRVFHPAIPGQDARQALTWLQLH
jgi:peroxiredoxin